MSVQLISWAYEQKIGSPTEKAVLLSLANAANHFTGECFPDLHRIAEETEFGYSTVKKAVASLVDKGYITRTRRRRTDGSYSGYYYDFPHVRLAASQPGPAGSPSPEPAGSPQEPEVDLEPEVTPTANGAHAPPRERPRNEVWDALTHIFGEPATATARTLRGKICRSLKEAGATPEEIVRRAQSWPRHFENATLTETALEKHWTTLGRKPLRTGGR